MSPRVLIVEKRTAYETYGKTDPIARRLLENEDETVARILPAHRDHLATMAAVRSAIKQLGVRAKYVQYTRKHEWFPAGKYDLVVTVGGDGTLLATSHHVSADAPILGINSAPRDSVGFFCAATHDTAATALEKALAGSMKKTILSRMKVSLGDRVIHQRVLNEALFCHASPAATSRYILHVDEGKIRTEEQKSSGFWIGPAAGSTAAQRSAGGQVLALSSRHLQFVVREPYVRLGKRLKLTKGLISASGRFVVHCKMRDARLFLDGVRMIRCGLGDVLSFEQSRDPLVVLGLAGRRS